MGRYTTTTPHETAALGARLAALLTGGEVIAFTGGLGAGKTTFCAGLAKGLGCTDPVSSPTYAVVNVYRGPVTLAHFDLYRISSEEDLEAAGFFDYLDEGAVIAVEWSERLPLPEPPSIKVDITQTETGREITIEGAAQL